MLEQIKTDWFGNISKQTQIARDEQIPPEWPNPEWQTWIVISGRGWGKSRSGAELVREYVRRGWAERVALVGETPADCRDVMIEGPSGILNVYPEGEGPEYHPTKKKLTWPNGAVGHVYSAAKPQTLRGPEHDLAWCDEMASWQYPDATWDNLQLGLRYGDNPQTVVTTTPKPIKLIKELVSQAQDEDDDSVVLTRGSTYDNKENLSKNFYDRIVKKYEGTRLGQQELHAEILGDSPKALWSREDFEGQYIDENNVPGKWPDELSMDRIVVAIDPAISNKDDSDETGIIVAANRGDTGYVLEDLSGQYSSTQWANKAINAYHKYRADKIIGEVNQGGDMVENTIKTLDMTVAYKDVRATRGKQTRAEPVASLYQQGRVYHVGHMADLEDQACQWEPKSGRDSPDRVDALTWAFTELMLGDAKRKQRWQDFVS